MLNACWQETFRRLLRCSSLTQPCEVPSQLMEACSLIMQVTFQVLARKKHSHLTCTTCYQTCEWKTIHILPSKVKATGFYIPKNGPFCLQKAGISLLQHGLNVMQTMHDSSLPHQQLWQATPYLQVQMEPNYLKDLRCEKVVVDPTRSCQCSKRPLTKK